VFHIDFSGGSLARFGVSANMTGKGNITISSNGSVVAEMESTSSVRLNNRVNALRIGGYLYNLTVYANAIYMAINIDELGRKVISSDASRVDITLSGSSREVTFRNVDMSTDVTIMQDLERVWLVDEYGNTPNTRVLPDNSILYTLRVYIDDGGTASGGGVYARGSDATVTARPDDGYVFLGWYEYNEGQYTRLSQEERYIFTITADKILVAKFVPVMPPQGDNNEDGTDVGGIGVQAPPTGTTQIDPLEVPLVELPRAVAELPFTDVLTTDWFYGYVRYVFENRIMQGLDENTFAPNANFSRAMVVATLYRMVHGGTAHDNPYIQNRVIFRDVGGDDWHSPYIAWAFDNRVVIGVGENRFAPNDNVTREQLALILHRFAEFMEYDTETRESIQWNNFADRGQISTWEGAKEALMWANYHELITGRTDVAIVPRGNTTRAEASAILVRFIERFEN